MVAALAAAGVAAASVAAAVVQTGFLTPSGTIACNAGHTPGSTRPLLTCTVFSEASPSKGQKLWSVYADGRVYVGYILGNAATQLPRLVYGRSWSWKGLRCASATTGLTCRNTSGHGFFLSRGSQRVF